jgi:hypothetical protein
VKILNPKAERLLLDLAELELISIERKDEEGEDWINRSMARLTNSYSENEPDYSDAVVLEPNPDFDPS